MEYRHIQYFYETWNIEILYHEIYEYRHINDTNNIGTIYIYMVPRNIGILMTYRTNNMNLVGGIPTPLKNISSSVGNMKFAIYGQLKFMFQTTNNMNKADIKL